MTLNRRGILTAGMAIGAGSLALAAESTPARAEDARGINVIDFGAKPGSSADQSTAIQRAIDAAAQSHGAVVFPPGIYPVKNRLVAAASVVLCGPGPGGRAALVAGGSEPLLESGGGVTLWGLTLAGQGQAGAVLVSLKGAHPIAVENCLFVNWSGVGLAVERAGGSSLHIAGCRFEMRTAVALRIGDEAAGTPAQIIGNQFTGCGMQIGGDAVINGNVVNLAPDAGIKLGGAKILGQLLCSSNMIANSRVGIGVCVEGGGYAMMSMNMIKGAKDGGIRAFDGAKPVGPDLAMTRSEAFRHLALYGNVSQ